jgi:ABC-2 type transport system permease protein
VSDLLAGEWLKLRTSRLLLVMSAAAVVLSTASVAGAVLAADTPELADPDTLREALSLTGTGALVVLLLGIVISAGEHRHGTAADTYLTTPRRTRVLAAKVATGAAAGLAVGTAMALAGGGFVAHAYDAEGVGLPVDGTEMATTMLGVVVYATLFAIIGVALGALVRRQVLAVSLALGWVAAVEHAVIGLVPDVGRFSPTIAGQALVRTPLDTILAPHTGGLALATYAAALVAAAAHITRTRDV